MPIAAKKIKKPFIQPSIKKWDNIDRTEHLVAVHWNKNMKDLKNQLNTKKDCCCIIVASLIICHERKKDDDGVAATRTSYRTSGC